jgi:antitoxin (DNA-binding transcriptional repressor) of toxin-antitoxin stability system
MLIISSREFRANQGKYLGLAAEGTDVLLKSRRRGSFKIVPVTEDDTLMSKEKYFAMLDRGLQNIKEGNGKEYTLEELRIRMGL